ncbi:MAG TPA: hypothetical protein VFE24_06625 [Pirellulales bacterium]|jgi:hypothetical protein|nr:hypothetical protein [Pirellulales bacterium]
MSWQAHTLDLLLADFPWGYHRGQSAATEPLALGALALLGDGRLAEAMRACDLLAKIQAPDGSLGVTITEATPNWPTGWAVVAWAAADRAQPSDRVHAERLMSALRWIDSEPGQPMHAVPELGHDTTLTGWPWVAGTNAWIEPTALALLAYEAAGQAQRPRAQEAARILYERQMPHGGCNYGNTVVLGQELVPHVQPTGLVMLALARAADPHGNIERALKFLHASLGPDSAAASLCYGLFALTAHGQRPDAADRWLENAAGRTLAGDRSPYKLALLLLAAQGADSALLQVLQPPQTESPL